MTIKFSLRGRKWKSISISTKQSQYLLRFYAYPPFFRIDTYGAEPPKTA